MNAPEMINRPRVLVLTPRYPYPAIGGDRLRISQLCEELAQTCSLTLLSLCQTKAELNAPAPTDGVFDRVERVFLPRWRSALNVLGALPGREPLQIAYYRSPEYARRLQDLLPRHDVCLAHLIRTGDYLRQIGKPTVLEMTDAISLNYRRVREAGLPRHFRSLVYRLEADRLRDYERRISRDFDLVSLVSATDRAYLMEGGEQAHVIVSSNGVDLARFPYRERLAPEPVVAFIGNMTSVQNLDACFHFVEEVLPLLRQRGPYRFRAVGRIRRHDARLLLRHDGVEVRANVRSVADSVAEAGVGVAPVRMGAGVQNKILEYMALGLPVVTSSMALEGFDARAGREVLVADQPRAYVAQIERLFKDRDFALELARAGRAYVERCHRWPDHLAPLVNGVHALAAGVAVA